MKAAAHTPSEHEIQVAFFDLLKWRAKRDPELALMHAIPNSGAGAQGGRAGYMKAEGVKVGIPDTFLPVARSGWHGLYIEFKSVTGTLSSEQEIVGLELLAQGYAVMVFDDAEQAVQAARKYLYSSGVLHDPLKPYPGTPNRRETDRECRRFHALAIGRQAQRRAPKKARRPKAQAAPGGPESGPDGHVA